MKLMKLFNEKGDLSDDGKNIFESYLDRNIQGILNYASDENELRLIGSLIHKRVGDMVSNGVQKKRELQIKFCAMSDEEFDKYLDNKYAIKYGPSWMIRSDILLLQEESDRWIISLENKFAQVQENAKALPLKKKNSSETLLNPDSEKCTGYWWHDEYGNESFVHDNWTYCPVCDHKK